MLLSCMETVSSCCSPPFSPQRSVKTLACLNCFWTCSCSWLHSSSLPFFQRFPRERIVEGCWLPCVWRPRGSDCGDLHTHWHHMPHSWHKWAVSNSVSVMTNTRTEACNFSLSLSLSSFSVKTLAATFTDSLTKQQSMQFPFQRALSCCLVLFCKRSLPVLYLFVYI